jgi:transcription antitermination factor NusG
MKPASVREVLNNEFPWFAVQVRSRQEKLVAGALRDKGYEQFLPVYESRRKWSDREKKVEVPLFPGYLFCRFNPECRLPVLTTPGVLAVLGTAKKPTPVDPLEIARIAAIVTSGIPAEPWPYLQVGQMVRIGRGVLTGLDGLLIEFRNRSRLVVSVMLLQRSVAVEIDRSWVVDAGAPATGATTSSMSGSCLPAARLWPIGEATLRAQSGDWREQPAGSSR